MTAARRWCIVAVGVALLIAVPIGLRLLPAQDSAVRASALLKHIRDSGELGYSGLVESDGALGLPVSNQFTDVADLLGGRTTMRVWWRSGTDWRVDKILATGETDLFHDARGTTSWKYESNRATRTGNAEIRLPNSSDLLPPALALRLLADADPAEVSRIPAERIAGVDALGLRLVPRDRQSSIGRVDVYADPDTGLPVSVAVFASGAKAPALRTKFLALTMSPPPASLTHLALASGAELRFEDVVDIAAAANKYAPVRAPSRLVGLHQRSTHAGAVGVYGRGVTLLIAIPLWGPAAGPLRDQLAVTPGVRIATVGSALSVAPLNLLLTPPAFEDHSWLFVGTVTPSTLTQAAHKVVAHPPRQGFTGGGAEAR